MKVHTVHEGSSSFSEEVGVVEYDFIKIQRARRSMSVSKLQESLNQERANNPRVLFGMDILANEQPPPSRFKDELAALRAYIKARLKIQGMPNALASLSEDTASPDSSGKINDNMVRPRNKRHRMNAEPVLLDDLVDVGERLDTLPDHSVELLVGYYVLKRDAKDLAKEAKVDPSVIGGRISQARRALRKCLEGLIPSQMQKAKKAAQQTSHEETPQSIEEKKRERAARFLTRRMEENKNNEVKQ